MNTKRLFIKHYPFTSQTLRHGMAYCFVHLWIVLVTFHPLYLIQHPFQEVVKADCSHQFD